jgi:DNA-binding beta-propeller fold protein YncE
VNVRAPLTAALAAVLLGAAPRPAPLTVYAPPAGLRPAGASRERATDAVLPDGRIAAPLGQTIFVGTNPLGVALSPDGRYAIVSNAEQTAADAPPASTPGLISGYSLTVVDARTMRIASVYRDADLALSAGAAVVRDPANPSHTLVLAAEGQHAAVRVFDLGADGTLTPELQTIAVGGFPAALSLGSSGRILYVADDLGNRVTAIDLVTRSVAGDAPTGYFPAGIAALGYRLYVTNGGLATYHALPQAASSPAFTNPAADEDRSSSLSVFALDASGAIDAQATALPNVRMDPVPDGLQIVGGARPDAIAVRRRGDIAYVTMANVDRVSMLALEGEPHVVGGLDLRLFVDAPYGTQPSAEVLSRDDKRLYVALAGLNAVAVLDARDPVHLHRLGLIPTGWYPAALALSPDGRYLYVANAKGVDGWGELQRVDLRRLPLEPATLSALRYNRIVSAAHENAVVPPLRSGKRSSSIDHVVYIAIGDASYDAIFGDLARGNGDASLVVDGASVTPNLHALASAYGIADNFYAADANVDANAQAALAGTATLYAQRGHAADPEGYPRAGYLFNALARAGLSYRDYGGLLTLSGYRPRGREARPAPKPEPPGLGGQYTLDVPALAALDQHVDLNYPGSNPAIGDAVRVAEFVQDMGNLVDAGAEPSFTYLWLPAAGSGGMADADTALGRAIEFLSHTPHWSSTAVFIVAEGAGNRDHVNRARSYALVVSPFSRPGYVGHGHLSVASVVKTEEELLGLPPISLADLLASDMADFLGQVPYPSAYQALP